MNQKKIFIPTVNYESWKDLVSDPDKQWKSGYSAKSVAKSWESQNTIPVEISNALSKDNIFKDLELLFAVPEFKVSLPGGMRPSQNDVFFLAGNSNSLISCTVEAKVLEDFDKTIKKWYQNPSEGKKTRLNFLLSEVNFPCNKDIEKLRYQLFHRLASSIIMAKKFHAKYACMIVQSFVDDNSKNHYIDFENFVKAYGEDCSKNKPIKLTVTDDINVYVMWVYSEIPE